MSELIANYQSLMLVFLTYIIAAASPGPSNMAIMGLAMSEGRTRALAFASGVITGSFFWGVLAATGVAAVLPAYADLLIALKILGGSYLLYLAYKSARSALRSSEIPGHGHIKGTSTGMLYRRRLLFHLTNPKSILSWLSIMAIGVDRDSTAATSIVLILGCLVLAIIIFCGYALLFSTPTMTQLYRSLRRSIEGTLALVFGFAGVKLLTSSQ